MPELVVKKQRSNNQIRTYVVKPSKNITRSTEENRYQPHKAVEKKEEDVEGKMQGQVEDKIDDEKVEAISLEKILSVTSSNSL